MTKRIFGQGVVFIKRIICGAIVLLLIFALSPALYAESAQSAITIEAGSGTVIYEKDADTRRPMASTTKIMTALIALETKSLESVFTVSQKAAGVEGSQMGLEAGDKIMLRDLLFMLMLKSANDAAEVIAENIGGSVEKFAAIMNERAEKAGLKNTHFANPHGLPDDNHYTTARELALIAREALKNKNFAELVATKRAKLTYRSMVLENSNRMLYGEYFNGVKTGFTKKAGRCLVTSATKDGVTLITVTLNDGNDWQDHEQLMKSGFEKVGSYVLIGAGEFSKSAEALNGAQKAVLYNKDEICGVEINGKKQEYTIVANISPDLYAPLTADRVCGTLSVYCNERLVCEAPLYLKNDVEQLQNEATFVEKFFCIFFSLIKSVI